MRCIENRGKACYPNGEAQTMRQGLAGLTYRDYFALDDDKRQELLEGDLVMVPAPSWEHQTVSTRLFLILVQFVESRSLGVVRYAPVDVVLSEENVVQPDLFFIAKDRLGIVQDNGVFGPPDLAVEILSPIKTERDRVVKKRLYDKYGVREYWIVDIVNKTLEILAISKDRGLQTERVFPIGADVSSPLLAGLAFNTRQIFDPRPT